MKKTIKIIPLVFSFLFFSCSDILEEDISDQTITPLAPIDGAVIEGGTVQFNWEEVEDADTYSLQVTDAFNVIVLDTTVTSTIFQTNFDEDLYFWKIKGENFAYETEYSPLSEFTVLAVTDLTELDLGLSSPIDLLITNDISQVRFSWSNISTASSYEFEILESETSAIEFSDNSLSTSEIILDEDLNLDDGEYIWQVRAINDNNNSSSEFSQRTFTLDTQTPPIPNIDSPLSDDDAFNSGDEITFSWTYNDTGNAQTDITSTIEIASDDDFTSILVTDDTEETSYTYTPATTGSFYWRVSGTDEAGNEGEANDTGVFTIN